VAPAAALPPEAILRRILSTAALAVAAVVAFLAAAVDVRAAPPSVVDLAISVQGDDYVARARLADALTPQTLEEIEAGIETTLRYRLVLSRRRSGLPDDQVARRLVECSVQRDALSRQYTLTRRVDGELAEKRVTTDPKEMNAFLTTVPAVTVARVSDVEPDDGTLYLRARGELGLVWRFYLIPWRQNTDWVRVDLAPKESTRADAP
jgi:hypothetical protein